MDAGVRNGAGFSTEGVFRAISSVYSIVVEGICE